MTPNSARVLIAEEDGSLAAALHGWLDVQPGLMGCGRVNSVLMLPFAIGEHHPDILLIDLGIGEGKKREVLGALRDLTEESETPRVVVLSSSPRAKDIYDAIDAGACGYVLKDDQPSELARVIRRVAAGEVGFSIGALQILNEDCAASRQAQQAWQKTA
jgi:DNA-binding NarL/FixJ family response regulator